MKVTIGRSIALVSMLAAAANLVGCSTWEKLDDTERGAVIGGGTGAVVGNAVSDSAGGTIIGGGVGALTGGLIGREMERDDRDSRYSRRRY